MVWKTCHCESLPSGSLVLLLLVRVMPSIFERFLGILHIGLVEVTATEEQESIRMLLLQVHNELLEHRAESYSCNNLGLCFGGFLLGFLLLLLFFLLLRRVFLFLFLFFSSATFLSSLLMIICVCLFLLLLMLLILLMELSMLLFLGLSLSILL